jgi:hypothetical protein
LCACIFAICIESRAYQKIQSTLPSREGFYILPYYFRIVNEIIPSIRKKSLFLEVSKSPFVKTYKNPAPFDAG